MLTSKNNLTYILERLTKVFSDIEIHNKKGLYDINRDAERFFCGLLNLMMDCDLVIANRLSVNHTGIDLIDLNSRIAVQITSSGTVERVRRVLEVINERDLGHKLSQLIILITAHVPNIERLKQVAASFTVPRSITVWDVGTLTAQIETLPDNKIQAIREYLQENHMAQPKRPAYILPSLPAACDHFVVGSRDKELDRLGRMLKNREPIFICGLGGIGKTQTVIQLAKQYAPPKGSYFVRCITPTDPSKEMLRETILSANFLGYHFRGVDNENRDVEYQERLNILRTEYKGAILVLDNLDWSGKSISDIQNERAYQDLVLLDLQLVFTTRSQMRQHNSITIGPLSDGQLLELMHSIVYSIDCTDDEFLALIHAVDGHTLMVELIARTLEESWGDITPTMLLQSMCNATLHEMDVPTVISDQNGWYREGRLHQHLHALYNLGGFTEEERSILRYATLLPKEGVSIELLQKSLTPEGIHALSKIIISGWLRQENGFVVIHPIIRLLCQSELSPNDDNCQVFLDELWDNMDDYESWQQLAEYFSNAADCLEDNSGTWAFRAAMFWEKLGKPDTALAYIQRSLAIRKKRPSNTMEMVEAYQSISHIYGDLAEYEDALEYQLKALHAYEQMPSNNSYHLVAFYNNLAALYSRSGNNQGALEYALKVLSVYETERRPTDIDLATSYRNVSGIYGDLGDSNHALEYALKAVELLERALPPDHPDLAVSYRNIADVYQEMDEHKKALEYALRALSIIERVLPPDHPDLASSYGNVGNTYEALGDYRKALEYKLKGLAIHEKTLPPDHPDVAMAYGNVGNTYEALGDYESALEYMEKALEIRKKTLPMEHPQLATSYNNAGLVYSDLGDHAAALKCLEKALVIWKKVLPENHPSIATAYSNIGIVLCDLGDYHKAINYQQKALEIFRKVLPENHPTLSNVYNNVGNSYTALGNHGQAMEYHLKAVTILEESLQSNNLDRATCYNNLAHSYMQMGNFSCGLDYLQKSLEIFEKSLPEEHPSIENTRKGVALLEMLVKLSEQGIDPQVLLQHLQ